METFYTRASTHGLKPEQNFHAVQLVSTPLLRTQAHTHSSTYFLSILALNTCSCTRDRTCAHGRVLTRALVHTHSHRSAADMRALTPLPPANERLPEPGSCFLGFVKVTHSFKLQWNEVQQLPARLFKTSSRSAWEPQKRHGGEQAQPAKRDS